MISTGRIGTAGRALDRWLRVALVAVLVAGVPACAARGRIVLQGETTVGGERRGIRVRTLPGQEGQTRAFSRTAAGEASEEAVYEVETDDGRPFGQEARIEGGDADQFEKTGDTCGTSSGPRCTARVRYSPTDEPGQAGMPPSPPGGQPPPGSSIREDRSLLWFGDPPDALRVDLVGYAIVAPMPAPGPTEETSTTAPGPTPGGTESPGPAEPSPETTMGPPTSEPAPDSTGEHGPYTTDSAPEPLPPEPPPTSPVAP